MTSSSSSHPPAESMAPPLFKVSASSTRTCSRRRTSYYKLQSESRGISPIDRITNSSRVFIIEANPFTKMGSYLSSVLLQQLENLDKDSESRRSAMKALKSYVKDLDSKAIPLFLAQVSETKENSSSREYTISLYEVLARVHHYKDLDIKHGISMITTSTSTRIRSCQDCRANWLLG
uniref:Uncharacterized protein n=1 Tax=Nelumbo nucifera TaxID=4432 RepID=A0A822ZDU1_NELNU|nr:TPA_asm: hypothetical protein HUJ06_015509 [Nelumbo nucifera]